MSCRSYGLTQSVEDRKNPRRKAAGFAKASSLHSFTLPATPWQELPPFLGSALAAVSSLGERSHLGVILLTLRWLPLLAKEGVGGNLQGLKCVQTEILGMG